MGDLYYKPSYPRDREGIMIGIDVLKDGRQIGMLTNKSFYGNSETGPVLFKTEAEARIMCDLRGFELED